MPNVLSYMMTLNEKPFTGGLKTAERAMGSAVGKIGAAFGALGVSFAAFKSIEGFVGAIKDVAETGKTLQMLRGQTGQSITDLMTLRKAFNEVGAGAESVPHILTMMQVALGGINEQGEPTKKIFEQLGLSIDSLKGRGAVDQLSAIGNAISGLRDQESKAAAARAIFGRGGSEILALFADPGAIKRASESVAGQAGVYERSAAQFAKLVNTMEGLRNKVRGIFVGLTEQIAPQLEALLDRLKKSFDSVNFGEKIGEGLRVAVAAIETGRFGDLLGLSIQVGLEKSVPTIANTLMRAFRGPVAYIQAVFDKLGSNVQEPGNIDRQIGYQRRLLAQDEEEAAQSKPGSGATSALGKILGRTGDLEDEGRYQSALANIADAKAKIAALSDRLTKDFPGYGKSVDQLAGEYAKQPAPQIPISGEASAASTELGRLVEALKASLAPISASTAEPSRPPGGRTFDSSLTGKGAKVEEGDRLAKIGIFVGQGQSAMMDYARRTAAATEKASTIFQQILSQGVKVQNNVPTPATFAA